MNISNIYFYHNTSSASTRNNSQRLCQDLGADLAVIKSEDESQFGNDLLRDTSDARSEWIRLNRNDDRKFYCVDDRPGEENYQKCIIKKEATVEYGTTLLP